MYLLNKAKVKWSVSYMGFLKSTSTFNMIIPALHSKEINGSVCALGAGAVRRGSEMLFHLRTEE